MGCWSRQQPQSSLHVLENDDLDDTAKHAHTKKYKSQHPHFPPFQVTLLLNKKQQGRKLPSAHLFWLYEWWLTGERHNSTQLSDLRRRSTKARSILKFSNLAIEITCIILRSIKLPLRTNWHWRRCSCRTLRMRLQVCQSNHSRANSLSAQEAAELLVYLQSSVFKEVAIFLLGNLKKNKTTFYRAVRAKICFFNTEMESWCDYKGQSSGGAPDYSSCPAGRPLSKTLNPCQLTECCSGAKPDVSRLLANI